MGILEYYKKLNNFAFDGVFADDGVTLVIVSGLPDMVAPIGLSDSGLPVGVQIIGTPNEDRTTIDFARGLADINGQFEPPPDYDDDETTIGRKAQSEPVDNAVRVPVIEGFQTDPVGVVYEAL